MLAGALLSFFGGMAQHTSNKQMTREGRRQAQAQFDQQMDHSVARRVADAERAGVHPLFALGASVGASPTLSAGGESGGNSLANGLAEAGRILGTTEATRAQAKRDEAQAAYFDALAANARNQHVNQTGQDEPALTVFGNPKRVTRDAMGNAITPSSPDDPVALNITRPAESVAQKSPGVSAQEIPLWVETTGTDGRKTKMLNPDLEWDEILHPGLFSYGFWRFWDGMKQNLRYAQYQLKRAGLSDQEIARQTRKFKARAKREYNKRKELVKFNQAISGRPIR